MAGLGDFFKRFSLWSRKDACRTTDPEALRALFKARYHNFKLLLNANNKALELMADMEEALRGERPFGMSFVRSHTTAVSVNVFKIIQNLDGLAPGRYRELFNRFKEIQDRVHSVLSKRKEFRGERLIVPFHLVDKTMVDEVGSKMANVGEVHNHLKLPVPAGFAVTSLGYHRFFQHNDLQTEIDRLLQTSSVDELDSLYALSADIQQLIIRSVVPNDLREAILSAYSQLEKAAGKSVRVSMRSSALGEDEAGTSFAGQYRSQLNVSPDNLLEAYKEIVASKYSLQAIAYRLNRGILDEDIAMCVGCMAMVDALSGGVIYTRNPLNIRDDSIFINSVWGLPKSVVDGTVAADLFVVSRTQPFEIALRDVKVKERQFICFEEEGVCRLELTGERRHQPSLTDEQILQVAEVAVRLEDYYKAPQDIEWAIDREGRLFVLQCRPLKQTEAGRQPLDRLVQAELPGEVLLEGGDTASSGVAVGPVFVVRRNSDTLQFPDGAVLVASQAVPRLAALLNRAAAVVTEQGSVAGHLANVAREFGVPALMGVEGATEKLQNGEVVTVDADGLHVYRGQVESLLSKLPVRRNLMEGSPVYEILEEVMALIVPLNLMDPDATDFKPKYCRTLHDITRFCHEKSVKEMFSFGHEHQFSERASKQLVCDVPMLWWFINLDDGFKQEVPGKFVHLDDIASIPVQALWEGIVSVPWEGPPPVDARGFMSVLMEATTNPALDPSMPSPYADRNYFIITRNFCSLSSRFGFHFSTIEALVSERAAENYASFRFKGGAADANRRIRRARFLAGILEECGFRAEVKDDAVTARLEGGDEEVMKEKLRILGYLIIHTRQLDMVMSNDAAFHHYKDKIMSDIRTVVTPNLEFSTT